MFFTAALSRRSRTSYTSREQCSSDIPWTDPLRGRTFHHQCMSARNDARRCYYD